MKRRTITRLLYLLVGCLFFNQHISAEVASPPETLSETPTHEAELVKSFFSSAYQNVVGVKGFSGNGTNSITSVLGSQLIYSDGGLGGWTFVEFDDIVDISQYEKLYMDVYLVSGPFDLKVYFGQGSSVTVKPGIQEGWNKVELDLDDYRALANAPDLKKIDKIGFINNGGYARSIYVDNIYVYGASDEPGPGGPDDPNAPDVAAPTPIHDAKDVKSIFSDHYTNIANLVHNNPGTPACEMNFITALEGDNMVRFTGLNWTLVKFDPFLNIDDMDYLHFDVWAEGTPRIKIGLGNWASQPTIPEDLNLAPGWKGFDIPLSIFRNLDVDLTEVIVMRIFSANGYAINRLYFDNIYAYKGAPVIDPPSYEITSAPEPIMVAKEVKSIFTDKYTNTTEVEAGQVGQSTEFKLQQLTETDIVIRMRSLDEMVLTLTNASDLGEYETVHFNVYCDSEGGEGKLEIGFRSGGSTTDYYSSVKVALKTDEWSYVNIPLAALKQAGLDLTSVDNILFRGTGNIYVDNIFAFNGEYTLGIGEEGKITMDWDAASKADALPDRNRAFLGVNLASAAGGTVPGEYGVAYSYPTFKDLHYFKSKGVRLIRLPFRWERVQHEIGGPLDMELDVAKIVEVVAEAERIGMYVMLDMHDYCRRRVNGTTYKFGESDLLKEEHFADVWTKLATIFKEYDNIWGYDLMNEPYGLSSGVWMRYAQAAIDGIRTVDTTTPVVVEGQSYASSSTWPTTGADLINLKDPSDNIVFQAHTYFDIDKSGLYHLEEFDLEVKDPNVHITRLSPFVDWLKENGQKGMIGEFGVPRSDVRWLDLLDEAIAYLKENKVSATYWVAGTGYANDKVSVQPQQDYTVERTQMRVLEKYIRDYHIIDDNSVETINAGQAERVKIYPNPISQYAAIEADEEIENIHIFTLTGNAVKSVSSIHSQRVELNLDDMTGGIYLLQVQLSNREVISRKIVKL